MKYRLGTFAVRKARFVGLVADQRVIELRSAAETLAVVVPEHDTVADLLVDFDRNHDRLAILAEAALRSGLLSEAGHRLEDVEPLPPLGRVGKQIYAAANYSDHVAGMRKTFTPVYNDTEKPAPLRPYMFGKICEPTGATADIILPANIERTDWEAELMVVIGRAGRNIPPERALEHIAGYMTTNDVSCRDHTWRDDRPSLRSDWLGGKSWDSFAPTGPYFTPRAYVADHGNLAIRLWVNGEIKQDGNTKDMTFGIEDQIAYASRMMTLRPGDVIATGTPAGTGQERLEFLKVGDVVEAEVEFCGRQRNRVIAGSGSYQPA